MFTKDYNLSNYIKYSKYYLKYLKKYLFISKILGNCIFGNKS